MLFPLAWAPTIFAWLALAIQVAPAVFLLSDRMRPACPSRAGRTLFALLFLTLQNAGEVQVNLTNAMWFLALLSLLIVVSRPPAGTAGRVFDTAALLLGG